MDLLLKFLRCTSPVTAGSDGTVTVSLGPSPTRERSELEIIEVHLGLQGSYSWGDFPYTESIVGVDLRETPFPQGGVMEVSATLDIPFKTLIEFDCHQFSYYAYVTPEGGRWTPEVPLTVSAPIEVQAPETVTKEELNALIAQLVWQVENSALPNETKEGLLATLEVRTEDVGEEKPATPRKVRERLESFGKELESGKAIRYSGAKLWAKQIRFIISRLEKLQAARALGRVPGDMAFRFYAGAGQYTGVAAENLSDFLEKLEAIDLRVLEFHLPRGDFENWVANVLGDEDLAEELTRIRERSLSGESLRSTVLNALDRRYTELLRMSSET